MDCSRAEIPSLLLGANCINVAPKSLKGLKRNSNLIIFHEILKARIRE
jgi:hypothetical protein